MLLQSLVMWESQILHQSQYIRVLSRGGGDLAVWTVTRAWAAVRRVSWAALDASLASMVAISRKARRRSSRLTFSRKRMFVCKAFWSTLRAEVSAIPVI